MKSPPIHRTFLFEEKGGPARKRAGGTSSARAQYPYAERSWPSRLKRAFFQAVTPPPFYFSASTSTKQKLSTSKRPRAVILKWGMTGSAMKLSVMKASAPSQIW